MTIKKVEDDDKSAEDADKAKFVVRAALISRRMGGGPVVWARLPSYFGLLGDPGGGQ